MKIIKRNIKPTPEQLAVYEQTKAQLGITRRPVGLRYNHLVITSDADYDGHHISGLMISNLAKFWPELFDLGVVYRFFTPLIKVWVKGKKDPIAFETEDEYKTWLEKPGNKEAVSYYKFFKGLGTSTPEDFKEYLNNIDQHLVRITLDEAKELELINMVFGKEDGSSDLRKQWLDISEDPIEVQR